MRRARAWCAWAAALAAIAASGCGSGGGRTPSGADGAGTAVAAGRSADPAAAPGARASGQTVPGRYIVVLRQDATPDDVARAHGMRPDVKYQRALKGFAGPASAAQAEALKADPRVASIEPDRLVALFEPAEAAGKGKPAPTTGETLPTGIDRVDADQNARLDASGVGAAVIDTGIWLKHEDLRVVGNTTFVPGTSSGNDDNGHGTHVAGIIGAVAGNGKGVRGIAPNTSLYAVKVLDRNGSGYLSWIIAGINWVTERAGTIRVANMSLGFQGTSSALDTAIHNSVAAGIVYVVAAGNSAMDASSFSPANCPDAIAVSAIADSDGRCGGIGAATSYGADDTFASFSNYGSAVAVAAPGVDIRSCWLGSSKRPYGAYAVLSGTSMASPHVAGAAVLYVAGGDTPSGARAALTAAAVPAGTSASPATDGGPDSAVLDGGWGYFAGDRDGGNPAERLLYAKSL